MASSKKKVNIFDEILNDTGKIVLDHRGRVSITKKPEDYTRSESREQDQVKHEQKKAKVIQWKKRFCALLLMLICLAPPALFIYFSLPYDPKELAVYPKEVLEYQIQRTYETFLAYKGGFQEFILGEMNEVHIMRNKIFLVKDIDENTNMQARFYNL